MATDQKVADPGRQPQFDRALGLSFQQGNPFGLKIWLNNIGNELTCLRNADHT